MRKMYCLEWGKENMGLCNYYEYRNSYDCEDEYNRSENCDSFKLDFLLLSKK